MAVCSPLWGSKLSVSDHSDPPLGSRIFAKLDSLPPHLSVSIRTQGGSMVSPLTRTWKWSVDTSTFPSCFNYTKVGSLFQEPQQAEYPITDHGGAGRHKRAAPTPALYTLQEVSISLRLGLGNWATWDYSTIPKYDMLTKKYSEKQVGKYRAQIIYLPHHYKCIKTMCLDRKKTKDIKK